MKIAQQWTSNLWVLCGLCGFVLISGCGGSDVRPGAQFQGTVTLDGQPLEMGSVHFTSPKTGETAYANLTPAGQYTIQFEAVDIGETYEVAIGPPVIDEQDAHALAEMGSQKMKVKIPVKYTNRTTSGLSATVKQGGTNEFSFELTSS